MRKIVSSPEVKKPACAALNGGVAIGDQVFLSGQVAYDPEVDGIPTDLDDLRAMNEVYRAMCPNLIWRVPPSG